MGSWGRSSGPGRRGADGITSLEREVVLLHDDEKRLTYNLHCVGGEVGQCSLVVFLHGMHQDARQLGDDSVRHGIHCRLRGLRHRALPRTCILEFGLRPLRAERMVGWGVSYDVEAPGAWATSFSYEWDLLDLLKATVREVQEQRSPLYTVLVGQSMGGQGAMLLSGYCSELFQAVVVLAGYPVGSIAPSCLHDDVPERLLSRARANFDWFLARFVSRLVYGPLLVVCHALCDRNSSFADMAGVVEWVSKAHGRCHMITVPDSLANSDYSSGYTQSGHSYFNACLLSGPPSDDLYSQLELDMESSVSAWSLAPAYALPAVAHSDEEEEENWWRYSESWSKKALVPAYAIAAAAEPEGWLDDEENWWRDSDNWGDKDRAAPTCRGSWRGPTRGGWEPWREGWA